MGQRFADHQQILIQAVGGAAMHTFQMSQKRKYTKRPHCLYLVFHVEHSPIFLLVCLSLYNVS
jgi:hypothetical protein